MCPAWELFIIQVLLYGIFGDSILFGNLVGTLAFSSFIAYYHNKPTSYHMELPPNKLALIIMVVSCKMNLNS